MGLGVGVKVRVRPMLSVRVRVRVSVRMRVRVKGEVLTCVSVMDCMVSWGEKSALKLPSPSTTWRDLGVRGQGEG